VLDVLLNPCRDGKLYRMSSVHPIDKLEAVLSRDGEADLPAEGFAELDLPAALEFAALRWSWWRSRGEDLLERLPELAGWPAFAALSATAGRSRLFSPFAQPQMSSRPRSGYLGVHELPPPGPAWEPGGSLLFFQDQFRAALVESGTERRFSNALSGALVEMASNAVEHAGAPVAPLVCFEVNGTEWAFGVTDVGRGALASIRENPAYGSLRTESDALKTVLKDGVSRTGEAGRGRGFTSVFKALVDRRARLRLRSGAAAAHWEGESPTAQTITFRGLPAGRSGFHIAVGGPLPRR
jgi:hypothetical protein